MNILTIADLRKAIKTANRIIVYVSLSSIHRTATKISKLAALRMTVHRDSSLKVDTASWIDEDAKILGIGGW